MSLEIKILLTIEREALHQALIKSMAIKIDGNPNDVSFIISCSS